MDNQARLERALAAAAAPASDRAFTLAVMRAAEAERFGREIRLRTLRGAGFAALMAALALPLVGWVGENAEAFQAGLLYSTLLFTVLAGARVLLYRVTVSR